MRRLTFLLCSLALVAPVPAMAAAKPKHECRYFFDQFRGDCQYQGDRSSPSRERPSREPTPDRPTTTPPTKPDKPDKPDPCACGTPPDPDPCACGDQGGGSKDS